MSAIPASGNSMPAEIVMSSMLFLIMREQDAYANARAGWRKAEAGPRRGEEDGCGTGERPGISMSGGGSTLRKGG